MGFRLLTDWTPRTEPASSIEICQQAPSYDVTPEGNFIMMRQAEASPERALKFQVVLNWGEELKRLVPLDK